MRDRADQWPRKKPGRLPLSAGGWQSRTGGSGGGGGGERRGLPVGVGRGVRLGAGGHYRVVERCEGLSLRGLGVVSGGEGMGQRQDSKEEIRKGIRGRHRGPGMEKDNGRDRGDG